MEFGNCNRTPGPSGVTTLVILHYTQGYMGQKTGQREDEEAPAM